jgi:hypothetical protein
VSDLHELNVVPFTAKRALNPHPGGKLTWQIYHKVRNAIVRTCREFGPTGPMGEVTIDYKVDDPYTKAMEEPEFWPQGDANPRYFIVGEQHGQERFIDAKLYGEDPFNAEWLTAITATLREHRGWGLAIDNVPDSQVLIFGKRLLVKGRQVARCKNALEVVKVVSQLLKRGEKKWWQFWK